MLLCFDYDGVFVDSLEQLVNLAARAQAKVGLGRAPTRADLETIEELTLEGLARRIEIPEERTEDFAAQLFELLEESGDTVSLFPKIPHVIAHLAERHTVCIITANVKKVVERVLTEWGLLDHIATIFDGRKGGTKAEKIREAAALFGFEITETAMVGDTRSDIRYGKEAGARTVAVTWGYQAKGLLELEKPDYFADSPMELLDIFA